MNSEAIEKFLETGKRLEKTVSIHFKTRKTIKGVFIGGKDYADMKKKNFWRIVPDTRLGEWNESSDIAVSRIFNGAEFTRLSE
ncbi:MAG: short-chain dehydrogenase [Chitinophagaceae bacterium]|uniref:short-chain dehydrogenase n=1 Tax=unclassified Paraflavitalea TaxID=2798305 RepID=UPI003D343C7E|nr:short-chain dehydrogenase [Chitinophagaceae bacterium]